MFNRRKEPDSAPVKPNQPEPQNTLAKESPKAAASQTSTPATTPIARNMAMIGASIKIKGEITGDENLQIDGQVEGQVNLNNHDLTIGETGTVNADLIAKTIKIHGSVNGDIRGSEMVVVSKSGKVLGNIVAPRVTLEDGAQFKGSIDMSPDVQTSKAPAKAPAHENVEPFDKADDQASKQASAG